MRGDIVGLDVRRIARGRSKSNLFAVHGECYSQLFDGTAHSQKSALSLKVNRFHSPLLVCADGCASDPDRPTTMYSSIRPPDSILSELMLHPPH